MSNLPFWNFSCEVYKPSQNALLELQNKHGLNVNIILFCCWVAANNQGVLLKFDLKKMLHSIYNWHERIVLPLRRLRDRLKNVSALAWAGTVREDVLAVELKAEQMEQSLLLDAAPVKLLRNRRTLLERASNACQSVFTYFQLLAVVPDDEDCELFSGILTAIFSELELSDALLLCRAIFLDNKKLIKQQPRQLELQLLME